eukprot:COSAG04_NODE_1908_length_5256_cov_8.400039_2_plen_70_part_00
MQTANRKRQKAEVLRSFAPVVHQVQVVTISTLGTPECGSPGGGSSHTQQQPNVRYTSHTCGATAQAIRV